MQASGARALYRRCCMVIEGPAEALHGRRDEREALERLLEAVRGGQSRVLVVCGEPGVGKTALVESAIRSASGFRILRAVGIGQWVLSRRWSFRSRPCTSCARLSWIGWTGFLPLSRTRSTWRSGCARGTHRIGFWSD